MSTKSQLVFKRRERERERTTLWLLYIQRGKKDRLLFKRPSLKFKLRFDLRIFLTLRFSISAIPS
jgi:hypothetical protein